MDYKERRTSSNKCVRAPICFLIDRSASMEVIKDNSNKYIKQNQKTYKIEGQMVNEIIDDQLYNQTPMGKVSKALKQFYKYILDDEDAINSCETATIVFDKEAELWENFSPMQFKRAHSYNIEVNKSATGDNDSNLTVAIEMAIDLANKQKEFYEQKRLRKHRPVIVLMTDAKTSDETSEIRRRVLQLQEEGKIYFRAVALSDDSVDVLSKFSIKPVINATNIEELIRFIEQLSKSVSVTSDEQERILDDF